MLPSLVLLLPNDGCLTVARVLARRGVHVTALVAADYAHVLRSRAVRGGRVLPDVREHPRAWLDSVTDLVGDRPSVAICGADAASEFVGRYRAELPASLRTFESAGGVHAAVMDKVRVYELAVEAGVRVPWTRLVTDRGDAVDALAGLVYPCLVKPRLGHLSKQRLGVGTTTVSSRRELLALADRLLDHDLEFLLGEIVPGPETGLEGAVAVRDADGRYPLEYGRRKVRQWPLDTGVGSLTESADVPETRAMNRAVLEHVGYHGIAACETKVHEGTGERYLVEINVRVPGSFGLGEACGVDAAWRLYAALAGLPLGPQPPQVQGRKAMLPHMEVRAVAARVRRGDLTPAAALRSWRGTRDLGVLALRDPGPSFGLAGQLAGKVLDRVRRAPVADAPPAEPAPPEIAFPAPSVPGDALTSARRPPVRGSVRPGR